MGFMIDGGRRMLEMETSQARSLRSTLWNFLLYFRRYGMGALLSFALITIATWTQIVAPLLVGQAVDCYFFVRDVSACTHTTDHALAIESRVAADESIAPAAKEAAIRQQKLQGLLEIFALLILLYVGGAIVNGIAFFTMNWTGHNVLRAMRVDLFRHLQSLSLRFYAGQNTGDLMSRITNDSAIIQQAISFGLLSVLGGALTIGLDRGAHAGDELHLRPH